ncbi:MAG: cation:proton antiporter, partial [Mucilaginibacter sp.]|nr:cation:proton antiporter [Mucilaginibacter sp.]
LLTKNSAVELFSTIGLLYIMFIAGIELDLNEFKQKKHKSLVFGFFTFCIPILIGFPICYYLLGYSLITSALTASMFATHTLVAYPIVSKYGISKNEAVAISVGGTILTDTAVLILLPVIMGAKDGGLGFGFWLQLMISLSIFAFIMFVLIPPLARWFFNRYRDSKTLPYVFVLFIVFLSAFLSQLAGVEPIIGAFVAGLALNKAVQQSQALMARIEFVGNAIFIPFFLISVGMLVDLRVLARGPQATIVAVSLTLGALLGKWLAALSTQKIFKYSSTQRTLIFGLSSAHAAATLAIILVGFKAQIIDDNILNGTIILILVTCVVASFATERAGKKLVKQADEQEALTEEPTIG